MLKRHEDQEGYVYCNGCGKSVPRAEIIYDEYPANRYEPAEVTAVCPECGYDDLEDAEECQYCGEYKPSYRFSDVDGMCNKCFGAAATAIGKRLEAHGTAAEIAAWTYLKDF